MKEFCKRCDDRYAPGCPLPTRPAAAARILKNTLRGAGPIFLGLGAAAGGQIVNFKSPTLENIEHERSARVAAVSDCIEMHQAVQQLLEAPDS